MEHAKKYVLVDPLIHQQTLAASVKQSSTHAEQTVIKLGELDNDIQTTLNSQLPDDEKAKLYMTALRKYKAYNKKPTQPKLNLETELAGSLPPNQQHKAKKLLRLIKENPDIDWSDKGELIYRQTLVPKSHVSDLFVDAIADKKPVQGPIGWETFDSGLDAVPSTLVKRRKLAKKAKWITS